MGKFKACLDETGISAHLFLNYKYSRKLYNTGRQKGKPGSLCLAVEKMWFGKTTSSNRKLVFAGPNPASAWYIRTARYLWYVRSSLQKLHTAENVKGQRLLVFYTQAWYRYTNLHYLYVVCLCMRVWISGSVLFVCYDINKKSIIILL